MFDQHEDLEPMFVMSRTFRSAFGQQDDVDLQLKLLVEEASELVEAASNLSQTNSKVDMEPFLKEVGDFFFVGMGLRDMVTTPIGSIPVEVEVASVIVATAFRMFLNDQDFNEIFEAVFSSNMSKLDDDGNPVLREDGKILKGPNYKEPDLTKIVDRVFPKYLSEVVQDKEAA